VLRVLVKENITIPHILEVIMDMVMMMKREVKMKGKKKRMKKKEKKKKMVMMMMKMKVMGTIKAMVNQVQRLEWQH
jgi:hypothetical protein